MLNVGIIGLGPDWESRYRPALARLSRRLRVVAVYDPVAPRAARAAEELQAACVAGIRALLNRPDVRAGLILGEDWQGLAPLRLALDSRKSLYMSGGLTSSLAALDALSRRAAEHSVVICPELRLRTAPATARIMELTAMQVGPVESAEARLSVTDAAESLPSLIAVVDTCSAIVRSMPTSVDVTRRNADLAVLQVTFGRVGIGGQPVQVTINIERGDVRDVSSLLRCQRGTIRQAGDVELSWHTDSGDQAEESLDRERPGAEVLLDHFARRVVGGLVPIPGLDDVCRILRLLEPHRAALAELVAPE
jgi:predicted dehydrogenase